MRTSDRHLAVLFEQLQPLDVVDELLVLEDERAQLVPFRLRLELDLRYDGVERLSSTVGEVVAEVDVGRHPLSIVPYDDTLNRFRPSEYAVRRHRCRCGYC